MSSGEPTDVTISMRVHGAETKLGKLALGPTGQLVIDRQEELGGLSSTIKPESMSSNQPRESISKQPLILTNSGESSGRLPQAENMATSMPNFSKPKPWKKP
jgi:hypothetical protein